MHAEEVEHALRPGRRPPGVVLRPLRVAARVVGEVHVPVGIRPTPGVAHRHLHLRPVDDHVRDVSMDTEELREQELAVWTDAGDVAGVVDVIQAHAPVEDADLGVAPRPPSHGLLRAGIVERLEGIRGSVDGRRRDAAPAQGIQEPHRGAVRPSRDVDPPRVDLARGDLLVDEVVDGGGVDVLRIAHPIDGDGTARLVELPVPVVPSRAPIVRLRIEVRRRASFGSDDDEAGPCGVVAHVRRVAEVEDVGGEGERVRGEERRMDVDDQRQWRRR